MFEKYSPSAGCTDVEGELRVFPQPPVNILKLIGVMIDKYLTTVFEAVLKIRLIVADHGRSEQIRVEAALI